MTAARVVSPEVLDQLAATDPAAQRARRDLARLHVLMGTRAMLLRGLQPLVSQRRARQPLRLLELGAGDGTLLLGVARLLAPVWPRVQLTLLDRLDLVHADTLARYAALGWEARAETADVTDWSQRHDNDPAQPTWSWDLVTTSLFLHHFQGAALDTLLQAIARRADRFLAIEPRRGWPALLGSRLVGLTGAQEVTRQDAVLSVKAGFRDQELSARWPADLGSWQLDEHAAGPFSHSFSARREGADR